MTASNTHIQATPGRLEQMSTRIAFFIAGFGIAAWAPLVPYAKASPTAHREAETAKAHRG